MIDIKFLKGTYTKDGLGIYRMHHLYAVLLETLADRQYYLPNDFLDRIAQHMNEEIKWNATMSDIGLAIRYLGFIGMIEANEENAVRITGKGLKALEDCRFQQLAATAFFNYQSMKNNETLVFFSLVSIGIALTALIISAFK